MAGEAVRVVVRCRPFNKREKEIKATLIINMNLNNHQCTIKNPSEDSKKTFTFDNVYDDTAEQINVYDTCVRPIVEAVMEGYNGTIFAYGQTGAGKTWTMQGVKEVKELRGVIPNAYLHIFRSINMSESTGRKYLATVSYLEIYNEEVCDLLSTDPKAKNLPLKQDPEKGVYVKGLTAEVVKTEDEIDHLMYEGNERRHVGKTNMNASSSRSHSIFTITIESSEIGVDGEEHFRVGKLNLVDLAGSERVKRTGASGDRAKEGIKINLSLSALGNVISALVSSKKGKHIPYRDSKLTRLLQDSLGGNAKTCMVAAISPAADSYDETLGTLRYANRAKNIKNTAKINEDPKDAMLRQFQEEIELLKQQLSMAAGGQDIGAIMAAQQAAIAAAGGDPSAAPPVFNVAQMGVAGVDEALMQELQSKSESEKAAILAEKDLAEEEKAQIAAELKKRDALLEAERQKQEEMAGELAKLQEKMLVGNEKLVDQNSRQEEELKHREMELREKERIEARLMEERDRHNEERMIVEEAYNTIQEEVEDKTRKLNKVWARLTNAKAEISELQSEFAVEREDMIGTIHALSREVKLKQLIIDSFIPESEARKIELRALYDEDADVWHLPNLEISGNRLRPAPAASNAELFPTTAFAMQQREAGSTNPRFFGDNISPAEVQLPARLTMDLPGGAPPPIEENPFLSYDPSRFNEPAAVAALDALERTQRGVGVAGRPSGSSGRSQPQEQRRAFPQSRGLVSGRRQR